MKLKNLIALTVMLTVCFSFLSAAMYIKRNAVLGVSGLGSDVTVVIDAGHGGVDPGSVSADGLLEKDVNLDIALKLNDWFAVQIRIYPIRDVRVSEKRKYLIFITDLPL